MTIDDPIPNAVHRAMLLHYSAEALRAQLGYVSRTLGQPLDRPGDGPFHPSLFAIFNQTVRAIESAACADAGIERDPVIDDDTVPEPDDEPRDVPMPDFCALLDGRAADLRSRLLVAVELVDEVIERIAAVTETGVVEPG